MAVKKKLAKKKSKTQYVPDLSGFESVVMSCGVTEINKELEGATGSGALKWKSPVRTVVAITDEKDRKVGDDIVEDSVIIPCKLLVDCKKSWKEAVIKYLSHEVKMLKFSQYKCNHITYVSEQYPFVFVGDETYPEMVRGKRVIVFSYKIVGERRTI